VTSLLELRGVRAGYDGLEVLHGVDLEVDAGSVLAVLGPNGAGKTTLMRVISGELVPSGGDLFLGGRRVNGATPAALARVGVCTVPEGRGVFPNLTVRENLWMMTHRGVPRAAVEEIAFEQFPQLADRRDQLAGTMSGGEQQMLALARAFATRPAVLLLDELSMGLAPLVVESLFEAVGRLAGSGAAVVIVEQFVDAALAIADRAMIVSQGRVATEGMPGEIREELRNAYFGAA
jgi:branched-chain amino acid transport system ATP-binding protein